MTADKTPAQAASTDATDGAEIDASGKPVDLRNLQDRFHELLDQRNHYNDLGREARDARNLLNEERAEKSTAMEELKKLRDASNEKMRELKERRNAYQDQAKALIAQKKGQKGALERSLPLQVRKLRNEIQAAMERQETTVLSIEKERDLVDDVRRKRQELTKLEAELSKQDAMKVDLDDTDKAIDELFKLADDEHEQVVALQKAGQAHHEQFVATLKEMRVVQTEANDKHKAFIAYRKKADELHHKAMDLREKVMAIRGERKAEYDARRQEMNEVNQSARSKVDDPKAIQAVKDDALEQLKKGGKISFGF